MISEVGMADKNGFIQIKTSKYVLKLTEKELIEGLPKFLLVKAIKAGKSSKLRRHKVDRKAVARAAADLKRAGLSG